jgi:hypothetical protein
LPKKTAARAISWGIRVRYTVQARVEDTYIAVDMQTIRCCCTDAVVVHIYRGLYDYVCPMLMVQARGPPATHNKAYGRVPRSLPRQRPNRAKGIDEAGLPPGCP